MFVDTIKPTSSSQLADTIYFRAAKDRPLWIHAEIDEKAIVVDVMIQIVDHRAPAAPTTTPPPNAVATGAPVATATRTLPKK